MTIDLAIQLINTGQVEARWCGLNKDAAFAFLHERREFMLSEIRGHWIRLTERTAPSQILEEIPSRMGTGVNRRSLQMIEPKGPDPGCYFAEGFASWTERYDYIVERSEAWFDNFRGDPGFDFDKSGGDVSRQQKALEIAYKNYAAGSLTLAGVADCAKMLRDAYRI